MSDQEKIECIRKGLCDMALGDIKRASNGGSKMGAFILCNCLIDAMTGFNTGKDSTGKDYIKFVNTYLTSYDGRKLHKDMRCKLVHSYSEGGSYLFTDNKPLLHLTQKKGKTIINLENFISDVEKVLANFLQKMQTDPLLRQNALQRFDKNNILGVMTL